MDIGVKTRTRKPLSLEEKKVRDWITHNRGVLSLIAVACEVSPQFVQQVAYGKSTALPGHEVERELRRQGWPGIRRKHA